MKIGIDIDDTITDTYYALLEYISREKSIDFDELKNKNYTYDELYNGVDYPPMGQFVWENFDKIMPNIKVKERAIEIMEKLIEEGHEIILITARNHFEPDKNIEFLKNNNIPYTKFYEEIHNKGEIAKKENIDLFLDDSINNCRQVENENINVLLFDAPYNKKYSDFKRVYSWEEVYKIVQCM